MWDKKSPLAAENELLYSGLVPDSGMCETTRGEAMRAINKLYYDAYNNGGCNHHNYGWPIAFLGAFLDQWLTNDGPLNIATVTAAYEVLQKTREHAEEQDKDYERWENSERFNHEDEPKGWDALEDQTYLNAIELLAHWVTWKVSRLHDK